MAVGSVSRVNKVIPKEHSIGGGLVALSVFLWIVVPEPALPVAHFLGSLMSYRASTGVASGTVS